MQFLEGRAKILAEDETLTERVVPAGRVTADPDGLNIGGELLPYDGRAFEQICQRLRHSQPVPASYLSSLPRENAAELMRLHLEAGLDGGDALAVYHRGAQVIAVGRPDLVRLSGTEVLESALEGLGGRPDDLEITRLSFAEDFVRFDLATQRAEHEVRPGDVVYVGVSLTHSLIGGFATRVEGHLHRLMCLNGAVLRECLDAKEVRGGGPRTRRLGADHPRARQQQREQIRRLTARTFERLNGRVKDLSRLATEPANLDHLATQWLRRSRLSPDRLLPRLRRAHAMEGGDPTAYGVLNAFTRVATHDTDLPPNVRNTLARMGGLLAFGHSRLCPRCWSLIAGTN